MKSILKALYMGNLELSQGSFPKDSEYRDIIHSISDIKTVFEEKLTIEDTEKLERLYDLQSEIASFDTNESFRSGFCVGALVTLEVMTGKEAEACE